MTARRTLERVGIVGGGIAGLAAARALADAGRAVTVLDKGRGPGGRASTRRRGAHHFDHGAQYFTARDTDFRAAVERWCRAGVVAEWKAHVAVVDAPGALHPMRRVEPRYVGVPGMSAVAGRLVAELGDRAAVRFDARVARLERAGEEWLTFEADDAPEPYDALVVCTPAPQALALLDGMTPLADAVRAATMSPCWAAMCAFDARLPLDADALFVNVPCQPLAWASRDSSKPGRPPGERWVLHATPAWTREHLDDAPERVAEALLAALAAATGREFPTPTFADAHRWRWAQGALAPAPGALIDAEGALAVAGDWCQGGRIEGAWLSGTLAVERLLAACEGAGR